MKEIDKIFIILVGIWNVKIFNAEWVSKELLCLPEGEEFEIGLDKYMQPQFKYKNIILIPSDRSVEIRIQTINKNSIKTATDVALRIIEKLPYTPNLKIGFNYLSSKRLNLNGLKTPKFSEEFSLNEVKLIKKESDFVLNVIIKCQEKQTVLYNFHYAKPNPDLIQVKTIFNHIKIISENGIS